MNKIIIKKKGQSVLTYVLIVAVIIAAVLVAAKRIKQSVDNMIAVSGEKMEESTAGHFPMKIGKNYKR